MRFPSFFRSLRAHTDGGAVPTETSVSSQSHQSPRAARAILPAIVGLGVLSLGVLSLGVLGLRAQSGAPPTIAVSNHALTNSGRIEGSAQQLLGESINLGAYFGGDLLVPGNPKVKANGKPNWKGQRSGGGSSSPSNYQVTLSPSATLGYLVTQSDPVALDNVPAPLNPTGSRSVTVNSAGDVANIGSWNTVRDLNLNGGNADVAVPSGTYGNFQVNSGALVLGTPNNNAPAVYNFQNLTFSSITRLKCVGPVAVTVRNGMTVNSVLGSPENQSWLQLRISSGGLNINSSGLIYGAVRVPKGSVSVNGTVWGSVQSDRLTVNSGGAIKLATIVEPTPVPTATPAPTPVPTPTSTPLPQVSPFLECVENLGNGQYRARFGTNVPGATAQIIPVGTAAGNENKFTPAPIDRNQPTSFSPGRTVNSFQVIFDGSDLTWTLRGRTVTASANSNGCPVPTPTPTVAPTATPTPAPTATPTPAPTATPTPIPNRAPVAVDDAYSVDEDGTLSVPTLGILSNDSDPDNDPFQAQLASGPSYGTLELNPNGSFIYVPAANYNGADSFTYRAGDGALSSQATTVAITVNPVNDAPVASGQDLNVDEDGQVFFRLTAADIDRDGLTLSVVSGPQHGAITGDPSGMVYRPAPGFFGQDSLEFVASDGTATSARATVNFTVRHVNRTPYAQPDAYSTDEDTPLTVAAPGVLANDLDDAGDVLSAVLTSAPAHGTLQLQSDGSFGYAPNPDYFGSDSFRYQPRDNGNPALTGSPITVTITVRPVEDTPVGAPDFYATDEDTPLTVSAPGVLANDSDADGDALTARYMGNAANGQVTLNLDGSFTFTPNANFNGTGSFDYRVNDGTLNSQNATVTITVNAVNDAPVATDVDAGMVAAGGSATGRLAATDVDNPPAALTYAVVDAPAHGTVTVNSPFGTLPGAGPDAFRYVVTPGDNYVGADSFTYRATDASGAVSNLARVTLNILAPPAPVVARSDEFSTTDAANGPLSGNVLSNDSGDGPLTATLVSNVAQGTLSLNADGGFIYRRTNNFLGDDSFTYRAVNPGGVASDVATVTIHVTHVNRAPYPNVDYYSVGANGTLNVGAPGVLGNDTDVDITDYGARFGDKLTASLLLTERARYGTVTVRADGSFDYVLNSALPAQRLEDSFYYNISDGQGGASIGRVAILIDLANNAPVAQSQSLVLGANQYYLPITLSGNDPDGDPITYELLSLPTQGTLRSPSGGPLKVGQIYSSNGIFYQRPQGAPNSGAPRDSFAFRVRDARGAYSGSATVTIRISAINSAPVAVDDEAATTGGAITVAVTANDTDADGDALRITSVSGGRIGSSVTITSDGKSVIYNPSSTFDPGSGDSFTYFVTDGLSAPILGRVFIRQVRAGNVDGIVRSLSGNGGYLGDGIVNLDGSGQTASANTKAPSNYPGSAPYQIVLRNTGSSSDSVVLRGPAREPGASATSAQWSVRYFYNYNTTGNGVDITDQVASDAGWQTNALAVGQSVSVRVEVRAYSTVPAGTSLTSLFSVSSARDAGARDVVGAISTNGVSATINGASAMINGASAMINGVSATIS